MLTRARALVGQAATLPEDLYHLIKKAVNIRRHLEKNRKDTDSKFRCVLARALRGCGLALTGVCSAVLRSLILVESRIHRLARYYKSKKALPPVWKYEAASASALVA